MADERPFKVFSNHKTGKFITAPHKKGLSTLAVMPCISHEDGVTVPVEVILWNSDKKEVEVQGTGKACPICWTLLKKDF